MRVEDKFYRLFMLESLIITLLPMSELQRFDRHFLEYGILHKLLPNSSNATFELGKVHVMLLNYIISILLKLEKKDELFAIKNMCSYQRKRASMQKKTM